MFILTIYLVILYVIVSKCFFMMNGINLIIYLSIFSKQLEIGKIYDKHCFIHELSDMNKLMIFKNR